MAHASSDGKSVSSLGDALATALHGFTALNPTIERDRHPTNWMPDLPLNIRKDLAGVRLWQEKRGELDPEDLSGNLVVWRGDRDRRWYVAAQLGKSRGQPSNNTSSQLIVRNLTARCAGRSADLHARRNGQSALNLAAARLRHLAGTAWSSKRRSTDRPASHKSARGETQAPAKLRYRSYGYVGRGCVFSHNARADAEASMPTACHQAASSPQRCASR